MLNFPESMLICSKAQIMYQRADSPIVYSVEILLPRWLHGNVHCDLFSYTIVPKVSCNCLRSLCLQSYNYSTYQVSKLTNQSPIVYEIENFSLEHNLLHHHHLLHHSHFLLFVSSFWAPDWIFYAESLLFVSRCSQYYSVSLAQLIWLSSILLVLCFLVPNGG